MTVTVGEFYAIYDNPKDYPDKFVVRRWVGEKPDQVPLAVVDDLQAARLAVPSGHICVSRSTTDDPVIVECWL
jgi:hypothetical protein